MQSVVQKYSCHALSGCHTTGRLVGKCKQRLPDFMACVDALLNALVPIQSYRPLSEIDLLETFMCRLYCKGASHIHHPTEWLATRETSFEILYFQTSCTTSSFASKGVVIMSF